MSDERTITRAELDAAIAATRVRPGPPVRLHDCEVGEPQWVTIGDEPPRMLVLGGPEQAMRPAPGAAVKRAMTAAAHGDPEGAADRILRLEAERDRYRVAMEEILADESYEILNVRCIARDAIDPRTDPMASGTET